jgi:hypothetical protein
MRQTDVRGIYLLYIVVDIYGRRRLSRETVNSRRESRTPVETGLPVASLRQKRKKSTRLQTSTELSWDQLQRDTIFGEKDTNCSREKAPFITVMSKTMSSPVERITLPSKPQTCDASRYAVWNGIWDYQH